MKSLLYVFLLFFFSSACKKDDQKSEVPHSDWVSGTFHVSGKYFPDCSNAPEASKILGIGLWEFKCLWCNLEYKSFGISVTDDNGNFYFEYTVTNFYTKDKPLQISLDWQGGNHPILQNIPSGVNIENMVIHRAPSTIVELYLNFTDSLNIDSIHIGGGFGWLNISAPYNSGYLMTYIDSGFIDNNYNEPLRVGISYQIFGNPNEYKNVLFDASICDTTVAVLNIER